MRAASDEGDSVERGDEGDNSVDRDENDAEHNNEPNGAEGPVRPQRPKKRSRRKKRPNGSREGDEAPSGASGVDKDDEVEQALEDLGLSSGDAPAVPARRGVCPTGDDRMTQLLQCTGDCWNADRELRKRFGGGITLSGGDEEAKIRNLRAALGRPVLRSTLVPYCVFNSAMSPRGMGLQMELVEDNGSMCHALSV